MPSFTTVADLPVPPEVVFAYIADLRNWTRFRGFGPVPGIAEARLPDGVRMGPGVVVRVTNTDGSVHHEHVTVFDPPRRYAVRMELGRPASRLLAGIEETLDFEPTATGARIRRRFVTRPRAWWVAPVAWLVTHCLLRPAVRRHDRAVAADFAGRDLS